jgi:hypothetical protein
VSCQGNNALAPAENLSPNKNQHHASSFDFITQLSLDFPSTTFDTQNSQYGTAKAGKAR